MKNRIKYAIIFVCIIVVVIISINIYQPNKEQPLKGNLEIMVYDNSYDYLVKCANKFMELNDKTNVNIKKIYDTNEIDNEINNIKNTKVTYIAQINRIDFDKLDFDKSNYFEEQDEVLNTYSKNFSKYRLQQIEYEDNSIGIPFTSRPLALYIREDMLNEYGYSRDKMNTWADIINIGRDIYEKSGGQVRIINATGQDYDDLISLLIMQYLDKDKSSDEIRNQVNNMVNDLKNNNILNLADGGEYLGRISSINAVKEISAIEVPCKWSVEDVPSISYGTSKFFCSEGDNLVVLNNISDNKKLIQKFITYVMTNNSDALEYVSEGRFFSSYLYTYKNKDIEVHPNNFIGKSPLVVLSNIEEKTLLLDDYSKYIDVKKEFY